MTGGPFSADVPLVGRDDEMRRVDAVLTRVLGGDAHVLVVSGQAGVGKTRLAREALARARSHGFRTLTGLAGPLQRDLSYAPLVEALRPLVRSDPARGAPVQDPSDLGWLFGDVSRPPTPALGDPGLERTRLFEAVCRLLERTAARQPVALLVDDVHWADRGSLALLHHLARGLAGRRFLLLLTHRPGAAGSALTELITGLQRAGTVTELGLGGLSAPDVERLAHALLADEPPPALTEVLAARAGGVPLFVAALVGFLQDSGALTSRDGRWVLAAQLPEAVPAVVGELLRDQVERLPAEARVVLDLLAVCGGQAPHPLLETLTPADPLMAGLAVLRGAGVLAEEVVGAEVRYRIVHPLLAEVAYDLIPLVTRRRRHAEVARAVEARLPGRWGLLAPHVRRAGEEFDPGHALDLLVTATDDALSRQAGDEALADARAARDLATRLGRHDLLPGLADRLAEACERAGQREEAVTAWLDAACGRPAGGERADRLHRAAVLELQAGRGQECLRWLAAAGAELAAVAPSPVHVSVAWSRLQVAARSQGPAEAAAAIADLDRLADRLGSPRARAAALYGRCHAAFTEGRYEEARAHLRALLDAAAELDDPLLGERARRPGFVLELARGDLDAARALSEEGLRLARRIGVPALELAHRVDLGTADFFAGHWDGTLVRCREVLDLGQRFGLPRGTAVSMALRGLVVLRRGLLEEARSCAGAARAAADASSLPDRHVLGPVEAAEAAVALAEGDPATAAATAARAVRRRTTLPAFTLALAADAQLAAGNREGAAAAAAALDDLSPGAPYPAALAAVVRGRLARDPDRLTRAAADLARLGFRYEAAVADVDAAEVTEAPADADGRLPAALRTLDQLGARPQADRARRLLRRQGRRVPAPARAHRRSPLSRREEEVVRLVARGLSNAEVAQRLYLSPRTVTTHLQHVYARLQLGSRAALVRYVLEELPQDASGGPADT
ncbi:ATP-binding protein [Geodermatophilus sp. SYSU D00779]